MGLALLSVLLCAGPLGCSFLGIKRAPANHARLSQFTCTADYGVPVIDGLAAVSAALGVYALADAADGAEFAKPMAVFSTIGVAAVAGAVVGASRVQECGDARKALALRLAARRAQEEEGEEEEEEEAEGQVPGQSAPAPAGDPWVAAGPPPGVLVGPGQSRAPKP